jgi:uncharacterized membrane protein YdbT with pleckstrin-like domain
MKFIKKKNFHDGEELLFIPRLHWFFTIKHMLLSLPFFLLLIIFRNYVETYANMSKWFWMAQDALALKLVLRHIFLVAILVVLLDFVWRIFQYLCIEYGVTNKRVIMKTGVLNIVVAEIPTDRIESIYCVQSILGRIFRYGDIYISGIGGRMPRFIMICRPFALRRKITEIIEKNKVITVVHGERKMAKQISIPEESVPAEIEYGTFVTVLDGR